MRITNRKTRVTGDVVDGVREDIEEDIRERTEAFDEAIRRFGRLVEGFADSEVEMFTITRSLWWALMVVGLRAVELIWARRRRAPDATSVRDARGNKYAYRKQKSYTLRCVFGKARVRGAQYLRGQDGRTADECCPQISRMGMLSIAGAFGVQLATECAHTASRMPFDTAKSQLERRLPYVPSKRGLMGIVDHLAGDAHLVLNSLPPPRGDVLVVQFDGRGLPRISDEEYNRRCRPHTKGDEAKPRRRRNKSSYLDTKRGVGKNKTQSREVSVGIVYGLERSDGGRWEPVGDKQYFARMGDREAVMAQLSRAIEARNEAPDRVVLITDGDPHYEKLHQKYLPDAEHVVDFFHVCEYLWDAACGLRDEHHDKKAFVGAAKDLLLDGNPEAVIAWLKMEFLELPKRGPGTKSQREAVKAAIDYIDDRTEKMPYDELLVEGIEIGSGAVESAVRQVVQLRFDGPGMRWGQQRPNWLLSLVCVRLSDKWRRLEQMLNRNSQSTPTQIQRMTPTGVAEARQLKSAA